MKEHREKSKREATQKLSRFPSLFGEIRHPKNGNYLLIPCVSSERREYIPMGFIDCAIISSDANLIIPHATLYHFGVLTSRMHMAWMRATAGRLKSDYRYSKDVVYNNFPFPNASKAQEEAITQKAEAVLEARAKYPDSSLADLYDPLTMPKELTKAHKELDATVDRLYRKAPFKDDTERVAFLFELYKQLTNKNDM